MPAVHDNSRTCTMRTPQPSAGSIASYALNGLKPTKPHEPYNTAATRYTMLGLNRLIRMSATVWSDDHGAVVRTLCRPLLARAALSVVVGVLSGMPASAQVRTLDDRLDRESFIEGLGRHGLAEALEALADDPALVSAEQDPAWPELIAVAQAQAALAGVSGPHDHQTPGHRAAAIADLLEARRQLIDSNPDDPRIARWRGDLARDLLLLAAAEDALTLSVEFGLASRDQVRRLRDLAAEAVDQADQALYAVDDWILAIEDDPNFNADVDLQAQRRRLMTSEKNERLPFLLGCARYLWAIAEYRSFVTEPSSFNPAWDVGQLEAADQSRQEIINALTEARDLLNPLAPALPDPWGRQAAVTASLADLRLGGVPAALTKALESIHDDHKQSGRTDATIADLRAELGMAVIRSAGSTPTAAITALSRLESQPWVRSNPLFLLLTVDSHVLWELAEADREAPDWSGQIQNPDAVKPLLALDLYQTSFLGRPGLELPRDTQESLVDRRLSLLLPHVLDDPAQWPSSLLLARAHALASSTEAQPRALELLTMILNRHEDGDPSSRVLPRALFLSAALYLAGSQTEYAVQALLELAAGYPMYEQAPDAAYQAAALLLFMRDQTATAASADRAAAEARLEQALTLCLEKYPAHPLHDRAALQQAQLALSRQEFDRVADCLATVPKNGSPESAPAAWLRIQAALAQARSAVSTSQQPDTASLRSAVDAIMASQRTLASNNADNVLLTAAGLALAECHLMLEEPEAAIALLDGMSINPDDTERPPSPARLTPLPSIPLPSRVEQLAEQIYLTIRTLEALGRDDEIDLQLQRLLSDIPSAQAGSVVDDLLVRTHDVLHRQELSQPIDAPVVEAERRLLPLAEWMWQSGRRSGAMQQRDQSATEYYLAEAYRMAGRYADALPHYQHLATNDPRASLPLFGLAECTYRLDPADPEALRAYGSLSARLTEDDRTQHPDLFWQTELRQLQVLDAAGRSTNRIVPRIRRLRLADPSLGGPRYADVFEHLEQKYR